MAETTHEVSHDPGALTFGRLRLGATDARSNGWYGMATLVLTEACLFAYLLFSYYYMSFHHGREWLPDELPGFKLSLPMTGILLGSSVVVWIGEQAIKKGQRWLCVAALTGGWVLGLAFVALEAKEWHDKHFTLSTDAYSSLFFTVTGFHMAHVVGGVLMLLAVTIWAGLGEFDRNRRDPVSIAAFYWHFVDVVWICVFTTIYLTPYLFHRQELFG
jgi:cytochrome c oxidase subunit III